MGRGGPVERPHGAGVPGVEDAHAAGDDPGQDAGDLGHPPALGREAAGVEVQGHAVPEGQDDDRGPVEEDGVGDGIVTSHGP